MGRLLSVNLGIPHATQTNRFGVTGIDKRPVAHAVQVTDPAAAPGAPGVHGDIIGDRRHHGGHDQAVYAYAREDLDMWEQTLQRPLPDGCFGENLTTQGIDVTHARIGERWRVGDSCVLEVTSPRIPCRTFAEWLRDNGWVRRFTRAAAPGAYLRVIEPGVVQAGNRIEVVSVPAHDVTIELTFRALTTRKSLLPQLQPARDVIAAATREHLDSVLASR